MHLLRQSSVPGKSHAMDSLPKEHLKPALYSSCAEPASEDGMDHALEAKAALCSSCSVLDAAGWFIVPS
jgi:hypothetical protein